jgi:dipeptidyl aminopeptidase/acylaminoacyl peptidase
LAIQRFGGQLASMDLPRKASLLADYEHAADFLTTAWGQIASGKADAMTVAGVRRTLDQYELTQQRILEGRDPYADRTGDLRLAFRSRTTGRLEPYRLVLPDTYRTDGRTPLIMALNGTEDRFLDRGDDAVKRVANARGYAILSPRASSGYWREGQQDLVQVVEHVLGAFEGLDRTRVYCTGASAGGFGTYGLATERPELFAAIACASGVGNYRRLASRDRELIERFTPVPTLILHGQADSIVPPSIARDVAVRLQQLGYPHELHLFDGHGHSYVEYAEQYLNLTLDYFDRYALEAEGKE